MAGENVRQFETNPGTRNSLETLPWIIVRFSFIEEARSSNVSASAKPDLIVAKMGGPNVQGQTRHAILMQIRGHVAGDTIWAFRPSYGGTGVFWPETGREVQWVEMGGGGLPPGTGEGKALFLLDNLSPGTPGWDNWKF